MFHKITKHKWKTNKTKITLLGFIKTTDFCCIEKISTLNINLLKRYFILKEGKKLSHKEFDSR